MSAHLHRGGGRHEEIQAHDDTPVAARAVGGDSGTWRRDKAKFIEWLMSGVVLLLVALITGAFFAYSDISVRLARVETKIELIQERAAHRDSGGSVAGDITTQRNTP